MEIIALYGFKIVVAVILAAITASLFLWFKRNTFKSSLSGFYHGLAVSIAFALLIASAAFNIVFTYGILISNMWQVFAGLLALVLGAVNIGAFLIDINLTEAIKAKQKASVFLYSTIRLAIVAYSILAASTVFNSGQLHIEKMKSDLAKLEAGLNAQNKIAQNKANVLALSAMGDTPLRNLRGDVVSMSNCKPNGHSFYLSQQVCKDYLANSGSANNEALRVIQQNSLKQYEESKKIPVAMTPVMGISNTVIFILIAFLLEAVAFGMVMFTAFYNKPAQKIGTLPHSSVQNRAIPPSVQPKTGELAGTGTAAAESLSKNGEVTDSQLADLIIGLWKENNGSQLSVNKLNSIIKEQIGYNINKARLIDVMNDSDYIVDKLINGKKAYYLAGDKIESKRHTSAIQSAENDGRNKRAETIRSSLSRDF